MINRIIVLITVLSFNVFLFAESPNADFYVSPAGNDSWSGTKAFPTGQKNDGPFKTISRARDAVRKKLMEAKDDIIVMLTDGEHFINQTIIFTIKDGHRDGRKVIYKNYPDQRPILTSGVNIKKWKKLSGSLPYLPKKAKNKIWFAELPDNSKCFSTLYDGTKSLPRASTAGFQPATDPDVERKQAHYTLLFPAGKMKNWPNLTNAELVIRPNYSWVLNILPLKSVDTVNNIAEVSVPSTYAMDKVHWSDAYGNTIEKNGSVWVENVFEALDQPGEWVLDSTNRRLYLWPVSDKPGNNITAPTLTELIKVEGIIDYNGPNDTPVENIVFKGLTFTCGDRFKWEKDRNGWNLQHDWEMFDRPTALLRFRGAQNCTVESCRFTAAGGAAIRLDLHCQKNRVANNLIDNIGGAGILLAGYGPGTKNVNKNNQIFNNHIHHIGRILWHSPAVFAWQSAENHIANNLIHHTPYTAIVISGRIAWYRSGKAECAKTIRWHEIDKVPGSIRTYQGWLRHEPFLHSRKNIVEKNEIHHVMQKLGDGNCIYISGTGGGNVIRQNFLHNSDSPSMGAAVRCDDHQHQTIIEGNIIYKNNGSGNGIAIKGTNNIINNIIADLKPNGGHHRGYISLEQPPITGSVIQRNIMYACRKDLNTYWQRGLQKTAETQLRHTKADFNLYYNIADPQWGKKHLDREREFSIEQNSISTNPLFEDINNHDFRLKPGSPALALGFEQIDFESIGLTENFPQYLKE
ncbi:MAG: right-handed parallel beta-helix repeat-containing protein [Planctomycetota bacterium]|jgi:hypothetical protein